MNYQEEKDLAAVVEGNMVRFFFLGTEKSGLEVAKVTKHHIITVDGKKFSRKHGVEVGERPGSHTRNIIAK